MNLKELKSKASMSELALIEKVEELIRPNVKSELKEAISVPLLKWVKENNNFHPDSYRIRDLVDKVVKVVEDA